MSRERQWYAQRLRAMTAREVLYRLGAVGRQGALRLAQSTHWRRWPRPYQAADFAFCGASRPVLKGLGWAASRPEAEDPTATFEILGQQWAWHADPNVWHQAPDTGRQWPRGFFAAIPYREGNPYGDARVVWEPSRLQQLVTAARAAQRRGPRAPQRVAAIEQILQSWVAANPPYRGVHYVSAMECALRLIAVCHALDLVRDQLQQPVATWSAGVSLVASHAQLVAARLSLYSSAGNHTLAETAGLIYAGVLFPELPGATRWRDRGLEIFSRESARQVLPDGGGCERSLHYSWFVTDLCCLVEALLAGRGEGAPVAVAAAARRGREFLAAVASAPERLPAIGDSDDGVALARELALAWPSRPSTTPVRTFADTGYTVLRAPAARLVFDHGPLGMAPLYGHGHADALAIDLRVGERQVFADCGTYSYSGEWRRYFRGTRAHNTVTVDNRDQARQAAPFIWSQPYECRLIQHQEVDGTHQLLAVLRPAAGGVVHWRGVVWDPAAGVLIWDFLAGRGEHEVELNWHLPLALGARGAGRWRLGNDERLALALAGPGRDQVIEGGPEPGPGWRAPRYGVREPVRTLQRRYRGPLPCEWHTLLLWGGDGDPRRWAEAIAGFRERA